jgi:hypothetical protein
MCILLGSSSKALVACVLFSSQSEDEKMFGVFLLGGWQSRHLGCVELWSFLSAGVGLVLFGGGSIGRLRGGRDMRLAICGKW